MPVKERRLLAGLRVRSEPDGPVPSGDAAAHCSHRGSDRRRRRARVAAGGGGLHDGLRRSDTAGRRRPGHRAARSARRSRAPPIGSGASTGSCWSAGETSTRSSTARISTRRPAFVNPVRDGFEIPLIRAAIDRGVPTLCICRGVQVLNVALGGTLHQHISDREDLVGPPQRRRDRRRPPRGAGPARLPGHEGHGRRRAGPDVLASPPGPGQSGRRARPGGLGRRRPPRSRRARRRLGPRSPVARRSDGVVTTRPSKPSSTPWSGKPRAPRQGTSDNALPGASRSELT